MKYFGLIGLLCLTVALAGCGGGSAGGSSSTQSSSQATTTTAADRSSAPKGAEVVKASTAEEAANAKLTMPDVHFPKGPLPKQLVIKELRAGSGPPARPGDEMTIKFLAVNKTGKVRFSSWKKGGLHTATFRLGKGSYFPGWDEGVTGMKAGSRREIIFPARLTEEYGPLVYVVDLLSIK